MIRTGGIVREKSFGVYGNSLGIAYKKLGVENRGKPSSRECTNRDICVIWPLACSSQFGNERRNLGTYELEEDAARAFDKVARILGHKDLNFLNSDAVDINGPRSKGADKALAAAVEDARTFVAACGSVSSSSTYIGVRATNSARHPWQSQIYVSRGERCVSFGTARVRTYAHTTLSMRPHTSPPPRPTLRPFPRPTYTHMHPRPRP